MPLNYVRRLPRWPTDVPLNKHEEAFIRGLESIEATNRDVTDFGRGSVKEFLRLCFRYLDKRGVSGHAMQPLVIAFRALEDVERGILPELFDPKAAINSGPGGLSKWSRSSGAEQFKVYASACVGALMKTGLLKEQAATRVARATASWARFSSGIIKASTVVNWRDELMQRSTADPGRRFYEYLVRMFSDGPNAAQCLDEVLRNGPPLIGGMRQSEIRSET